MNEYLNGLKAKFNYSDELMNFLASAIPSIIQYYGEEHKETVLQALANCEIHIQDAKEDPKQYLNGYFGKEKEWEMPDLGGAFYHNEISVNDNRVVAKPIIYVKTVYYHQHMPFDFNDEKKLNTLLHEILHAVKGYGKIKVQDGKIIDSTGLMQDTYTYDTLNGVKEEKNERVGIEEAVNEVDTITILGMITGRQQDIRGYVRAGSLAKLLLEHKDIATVIKNSQFNGDDNWIQYLGEDSKKIIESFDVLVNMMYVSFRELNDKELMARKYAEADMAQDFLEDFIANYCTKEQQQAFEEARKNADQKTADIIKQTIINNDLVQEQAQSKRTM